MVLKIKILFSFLLIISAKDLFAQPPIQKFWALNQSSCLFRISNLPTIYAAYSLRKLNCTYTGNCIRVRKGTSTTYQDIGFTATGVLDTVSLKTFLGTNTGYVYTWYD